MDTFVEALTRIQHLHKFCGALELSSERYEMARCLSRSPDAPADGSPTTNVHWQERDVLEIEDAEEQPLRIHAHACFRFYGRKRLTWEHDLKFMDSIPIASTAVSGRQRGKFELLGDAAFHYLQVAKTSTIATAANHHPFSGHLVNSEWVVNLWQQGKVGSAMARAVTIQETDIFNATQNGVPPGLLPHPEVAVAIGSIRRSAISRSPSPRG